MIKKWIFLTAISLITFLSRSQEKNHSQFEKKKLSIKEINFIGSFYGQDGNHSAVTGGLGTESLTDLTGFFNITLNLYPSDKYEHHLDFNVGIDYYTSASSDKIDPDAITSPSNTNIQFYSDGVTSPSYSDTRIYPAMDYSFTNLKRKFTVGGGLSYSTEYDYFSRGVGVHFSKTSKDNARDIAVKANVFFDEWAVILPVELRPEGYGSGSEKDNRPIDHKPRNTYNTSISLSQVMNKRLQMAFILEPSYQTGQLSTGYQRVYFQDNSVAVEKLPEERLKIAAGIRTNYFLKNFVVLRSFLRYYQDDWGLMSETIQLETALKIHPKFSLAPMYRLMFQQGIDYFKEKNQNAKNAKYYTSDFDLSTLQSHFIGMEFHVGDANGIFHIVFLKQLDLRLGYYLRSDGLNSYITTLGIKFW